MQFNTYNLATDSAFNIDTIRIAVIGDGNIGNIDVNAVTTAAVTPEPSSLALLGTGLLGIVGWPSSGSHKVGRLVGKAPAMAGAFPLWVSSNFSPWSTFSS